MDLVALEEIRQVKYRYLRCVDLKLWDDLADTFTQEATVDYGTPALGDPIRLAGRDAIVGFLRDKLGPEMLTTHFATQPEISVDGDTASGTWAFTWNDAKGKPTGDRGKFTEIWKKQADGAWKCVADIWNSDLPLPATGGK